ncbi:nucleoside-diphosphate kinase [Methanonatronarchaeum sp. AMET6-2]|uniref:nucleoside-diphosphate kinase n=1 Tax=Methanonatronarchaeum sp. AMET6-2 TaxID=2933293 RepID=UPI0012077411|nr:nucleoside-diphosphate kinase [Methanonatronarchaeum sp. AMET6-2]RZN61897.1 MAG: nucleoside-diphosphate kinase [Methanonatronarchaeia archaeon]UOY10628.1 nucleoside-diphosphate kinase [Methanonatronarchaeum sp. AMET6-2]
MKTFLAVKPDGVERGLIGEVIKRVEDKGLKVTALKMIWLDREQAEKHYEEHKDKDFFNELIDYITSKPIVAMAIEGPNAVPTVRKLIGATNPAEAAPGTIRGDYGLEIDENIVHAADSPESAERELDLYFQEDEFQEY